VFLVQSDGTTVALRHAGGGQRRGANAEESFHHQGGEPVSGDQKSTFPVFHTSLIAVLYVYMVLGNWLVI
jgi:hypothetical protein